MAHAYTPGLRVTRATIFRKERILPLKGEVIAKVGEHLTSEKVVARTELPGKVEMVNVLYLLGCEKDEVAELMVKKEGDTMKKDEVIAQTRPIFGLKFLQTRVKSPIEGTIEKISDVTGQVLLREPPQPVEIRAYVDGKVVEVIPNEGVIMETICTFIQGIFGIGGETWGEIKIIASSSNEVLRADKINAECKGKIIVGGSLITYEAFQEALKRGAKGIIAGGINDSDMRKLLGSDIGVAITGTENIGLTIIVTEGFGEIAMAEKTFNLLKTREGQKASINGATQIRAGVIRPEIIIPWEKHVEISLESVDSERGGMTIGDPVRIIREPFFGRIGKVKELPSDLQVVESGAKVRILKVEFSDGTQFIVPRANVEIIED